MKKDTVKSLDEVVQSLLVQAGPLTGNGRDGLAAFQYNHDLTKESRTRIVTH